MYTVAMLVKVLPLYATFGIAIGVGAVLALIVGVLTLRIAGIFFVIFASAFRDDPRIDGVVGDQSGPHDGPLRLRGSSTPP